MTTSGMNVEPQSSHCLNCSAWLEGEYCARCGQRRIDPEDLSARRFLHELTDEVTNFRAKLTTLRTLRGLLKPGFLTAEYLAGRRAAYLPPFRLYLVCAAIFFVSAPVAGFTLASMLAQDPTGDLRRLVLPRAAARGLDTQLFNARFDIRVQSIFTLALGVAATIFALMLQLLFRKKRMPYGAHLIFALHFTSFMYLVTIAAGFGRTIGVPMNVAVLTGYATLVVYLILGLRRVYSEAAGAILVKAAALLLLTLVLNRAANDAAIWLTLSLV